MQSLSPCIHEHAASAGVGKSGDWLDGKKFWVSLPANFDLRAVFQEMTILQTLDLGFILNFCKYAQGLTFSFQRSRYFIHDHLSAYARQD